MFLFVSFKRHAHVFAKLSYKNNYSNSQCLAKAFVKLVTGIFIWVRNSKQGIINKLLFKF